MLNRFRNVIRSKPIWIAIVHHQYSVIICQIQIDRAIIFSNQWRRCMTLVIIYFVNSLHPQGAWSGSSVLGPRNCSSCTLLLYSDAMRCFLDWIPVQDRNDANGACCSVKICRIAGCSVKIWRIAGCCRALAQAFRFHRNPVTGKHGHLLRRWIREKIHQKVWNLGKNIP